MTKEELEKLSKLNKDIKLRYCRIAELEACAMNTVSSITGLPYVKKISDKTALSVVIADLRTEAELKNQEALLEYSRLIRFIDSVDNPEMRQILHYKYINNLTWYQVARHIGAAGDGSTQRKKVNEFLKLSQNS